MKTIKLTGSHGAPSAGRLMHSVLPGSILFAGALLVAAMMSAPAASATAALPDVKPLTARLPVTTTAQKKRQTFMVLAYHDIRTDLRKSFATQPDHTAVDADDFVRQLGWLHQNGYHPVSVQQIAEANAGGAPLPDKAVLLTFDDGLKSVYTHVFPLLRQFGFPAVIAVVGEWIDTPAHRPVQFGDQLLPRSGILTWDEVREMVASGLVEVASHSYAMHKGIHANPQGNLIPAAIARQYFQDTRNYEDDSAYAARIAADLQKNANTIKRETAIAPTVMVWPYGASNLIVERLASEAGMPLTMTLESGRNQASSGLSRIRRTMITSDTSLPDFVELLQQKDNEVDIGTQRQRVIHVDLDYVYDIDPNRQEANLSRLLDRIQRLNPTTVYLQAYADPDGDGAADAVYFPNRHMPVKSDLFSRAAWQLRTRTEVQVFAWMPVLAFKLPAEHASAGRVVETMPGASDKAGAGRYHRLSVFDPAARQTVTQVYEDLGKNAVFDGVLFHDDATLSDYEDASAAAIKVYHEEWQLPASLQAIRNDPAMRLRWTTNKTTYLNNFTVSLATTLRLYHPQLKTARNLYAQPLLNPTSEDWYAQSFTSFLSAYDYTAVMAMPYMEGAENPMQWLEQLISKVRSVPDGLNRTVFELQSQNWATGKPVPAADLAAQLRRLNLLGARHFGYYPDDFHQNHPDEDIIRPVISVRSYPVTTKGE